MSVRAVRNNNPGNIRIGQPWQGLMPRAQMTPEQAAETAFCVFVSPAMGFRAMAEIFHTYHNIHGFNSLREVISHWAPPNENDTEAYVQAVCQATHYGPDAPFPFGAPAAMQELCHAVSVHECGGWLFTSADLVAGCNAAH